VQGLHTRCGMRPSCPDGIGETVLVIGLLLIQWVKEGMILVITNPILATN
jgi:hypothetical protein